MTTIFYFLSIVFFMYEIIVLINPFIMDKLKIKADDTKEAKFQGCLIAFIIIFYVIWIMIGLALSHQWKYFAVLLALSIFNSILSHFFKIRSFKIFRQRVDSIISSIVLFWIFMNHFHPGVLKDFLVW